MPTRGLDDLERTSKERVHQVTLKLLAAGGYWDTTLPKIAREAGLSEPELSEIYDSKDAILLDLLTYSLDAWEAAARNRLRGPDCCEDRLWEHFRSAIQFFCDHPAQALVIRVAWTHTGGAFEKEVEDRITVRRVRYLRDLEVFFTEAMQCKEVQDGNPKDLARSWWAFQRGLLTDLVFRKPGATPSDKQLQGMWTIVWRGLQGSPKAGAPSGARSGARSRAER